LHKKDAIRDVEVVLKMELSVADYAIKKSFNKALNRLEKRIITKAKTECPRHAATFQDTLF
jgi:hypothetical protein